MLRVLANIKETRHYQSLFWDVKLAGTEQITKYVQNCITVIVCTNDNALVHIYL